MYAPAPARLLLGHTVHQRSTPFTHSFRYRLALIDIDIDRVDAAGKLSWLFGTKSGRLFSFRARDHGYRGTASLRSWAQDRFRDHGIDVSSASIRLVTFMRHLFYKFAPLSLWVAQASDGRLLGIIYEVNNTFGETHSYVAATPAAGTQYHSADKAFHVSPFFDVSGRYRFSLDWQPDRLRLVIASQVNGAQAHVATIAAKPVPLTSGALARLAILRPFSSLAVSMAIHWQALKLWLRGARYRSKPQSPSMDSTRAKSENM